MNLDPHLPEGKVEKNLHKLVTLLRHDPTASLTKQREVLDVTTDDSVRNYHKRLVEKNWAVAHNPVLTEQARRVLDPFWLFIQTTFHGYGNAGNGEDANYQVDVAETIQRRLTDHFSNDLILNSIDIVLGCDWDLVASLQATDIRALHLFVTSHVRTCKHVLKTSTAWGLPSHVIQNGGGTNDGLDVRGNP